MEMREIYDCQEILDLGQKIRTAEEFECDKLFRDKSTIEWLSERKNNLNNEVVKLEESISKSNKKREALEKKLGGEHFVDTLRFEINSYDIFCYRKDGDSIYTSNYHSEIYINHHSCDKSAVIKELIDNYDICIRENFVVIFLKSLKISIKECGPGPEYMLDAIKDKEMRIKINEELASLTENKEIFGSAILEKNSKILIDGPLQSEMFDSSALETQKAEIFSELYDLPKIVSFIDTYIDTHQNEQQHQEL